MKKGHEKTTRTLGFINVADADQEGLLRGSGGTNTPLSINVPLTEFSSFSVLF